jgi:hypothetical protein
VRRIYELGILPERRIVNIRVVAEKDLPILAAALRQRGYLKEATPCA